jgi:hypothetical protein
MIRVKREGKEKAKQKKAKENGQKRKEQQKNAIRYK